MTPARIVLKPLPAGRFAISRYKAAKVNIDYHVEFEAHYYSVPHRLVGAKVDVRATGALLDVRADPNLTHPADPILTRGWSLAV